MLSITQYLTESVNIKLVDLKPYNFILDLSEVKYFNPKNPKILLNKNAIRSLIKARSMLPKNYNFIINSGYRDYDEQFRINEFMKKKLKKQYPNNWEEKLNIFTGGQDYLNYLKTHKGEFSHMSHASGNAVDIVGIIDNNNKKLDMGDQTNTDADRIDYYENSKEPKEIIIRDNRRLLKDVLIRNHFRNFKDEWWHWGYYG